MCTHLQISVCNPLEGGERGMGKHNQSTILFKQGSVTTKKVWKVSNDSNTVTLNKINGFSTGKWSCS